MTWQNIISGSPNFGCVIMDYYMTKTEPIHIEEKGKRKSMKFHNRKPVLKEVRKNKILVVVEEMGVAVGR